MHLDGFHEGGSDPTFLHLLNAADSGTARRANVVLSEMKIINLGSCLLDIWWEKIMFSLQNENFRPVFRFLIRRRIRTQTTEFLIRFLLFSSLTFKMPTKNMPTGKNTYTSKLQLRLVHPGCFSGARTGWVKLHDHQRKFLLFFWHMPRNIYSVHVGEGIGHKRK